MTEQTALDDPTQAHTMAAMMPPRAHSSPRQAIPSVAGSQAVEHGSTLRAYGYIPLESKQSELQKL